MTAVAWVWTGPAKRRMMPVIGRRSPRCADRCTARARRKLASAAMGVGLRPGSREDRGLLESGEEEPAMHHPIDPTFYRSPAVASAAPPEALAYVAAFDPAGN